MLILIMDNGQGTERNGIEDSIQMINGHVRNAKF